MLTNTSAAVLKSQQHVDRQQKERLLNTVAVETQRADLSLECASHKTNTHHKGTISFSWQGTHACEHFLAQRGPKVPSNIVSVKKSQKNLGP